MTYSRFKTFQQFQAMGGVIIRGSRVIICMENNTTPSIMQTTAPDRVCISPPVMQTRTHSPICIPISEKFISVRVTSRFKNKLKTLSEDGNTTISRIVLKALEKHLG